MEPHISAFKGRGGRRPGWGRKRSGRRFTDPPHRARPAFDARLPSHAVFRSERVKALGLRNGPMYRALRSVLTRYLTWTDFRVVHVSIQNSHLHFLIEASNAGAF